MGWIRHRKCKHLTIMLPSLKLLEAGTSKVKTKKTAKTPKSRRLNKGEALSQWDRMQQEHGDF